MPGLVEKILSRFGNLGRLLQQADTQLPASRLAIISLILASVGVTAASFCGCQTVDFSAHGAIIGLRAMLWILFRRKRRLRAFAVQLPEALEMLGRSLRAGQSLARGSRWSPARWGPAGQGVRPGLRGAESWRALDESLDSLTERIPDLDLRFFATAVVLQRQTGGDLAEILDKLGRLIRERFQIRGQVRALTGEGRLSGIVLLASPWCWSSPSINSTRISHVHMFTDPLGKKMVGVALFLQIDRRPGDPQNRQHQGVMP